MNNLFSLPKKFVCGFFQAEDKEQWKRDFDKTIDDFVEKSGTKKDRNKITFGDMSRGMCWEDVVDFETLRQYMHMEVKMRIETAVNISLACGSSIDRLTEIYQEKEKLYMDCIYPIKVTTDLYFNILKTLPIGYGGMLIVAEDLNERNTLHFDGIKVKMEIYNE